jgi:hypothetical protein
MWDDQMVTELVQAQQAQQHEESAPVMSMLKQLLQGQEAIQRENAEILKKIEALEATIHRKVATPVSSPSEFQPADQPNTVHEDSFTSSSVLQPTSNPTTTNGSAPKHWLMPIPKAKGGQEFTAEDIDTSELISAEDAKWSYCCMLVDSRMSAVAVKLAREVYFGDSVLERCSPRWGWQSTSLAP